MRRKFLGGRHGVVTPKKTATSPILTLLALSALTLWTVPASADDLATRFADLYQAAQKEGKVAYYNEGRVEENSVVAAFWKKTFPKVRLLITAKQTMALIPTIETERAAGHGRADVVTITEPFITAEWQAKGYYRPYKVRGFAKHAPAIVDPDGTQYVNSIYLLMPAYNTTAFPGGKGLPQSFADFLDPKWKGKMVLADPKTAGSNLTYGPRLPSWCRRTSYSCAATPRRPTCWRPASAYCRRWCPRRTS
jgi:iron(III) transport system substrate-binding protein